MSNHVYFTALGEDILHLILTQLDIESRSSLRQVARVSRFCKRLVDPFLYRSIELGDESKRLARTERMTARLLDPNDDMSKHVRDLRIGEFYGGSLVFNADALERVIGKLEKLQSFSWTFNRRIPENVISRLESCWPNARLSVTTHRRDYAPDVDINMDMRLLSSPLLYSLSYCVFYLSVGTASLVLSEFPKLKEILLKSTKLRVLDLRVHMGVPVYQNSGNKYKMDLAKELGPLNLPLTPSDQFPSLQELKISDWMPYDLSREHCAIWRECMDWTRLHRLDLGAGCPQPFFEQLAGRVPNLKWLRLGFKLGPQDHGRFTCEDPAVVRAFVKSIDGLEELFITNFHDDPSYLFSNILEHHGTLRTLAFHTPPDQAYERETTPVWTADELVELLEEPTKLSHLEIDIGLVEAKSWPYHLHPLLASFNRLRTLKLYIEIPTEESDFSSEYGYDAWGCVRPPPLNEKLARDVASDLFRQFFKHDAYAFLNTLEVCFTRLDIVDRMDSDIVENLVRVRRLERDDGARPEDGGFSVEYKGGWCLAAQQ